MEIAIALDAYDDLFSDFDLRGYGDRALSKDFLDELRVRLRRAGLESVRGIVLLVPSDRRRPADEALIIERIRIFFSERRDHYRDEIRKSRLKASAFIAAGIALLVAANVLARRLPGLPLLNDSILIPSWFFVWSGLELFVNAGSEIGRKRRYYASLARYTMAFADIEGYRGWRSAG